MEGLGSPSCDSGFYMMPDLCLKVQRKREFMNFQNESPKSGKTRTFGSVSLSVIPRPGGILVLMRTRSKSQLVYYRFSYMLELSRKVRQSQLYGSGSFSVRRKIKLHAELASGGGRSEPCHTFGV